MGLSVGNIAAAVGPGLLRACCSASSMWVANVATISPSGDTEDGKLHITPANLPSQFHRSIEPHRTAATLKRVFSDGRYFWHHDPLPPNFYCADEGAANHMRLCAHHCDASLEIFVFRKRIVADAANPSRRMEYVNLRQSMRNAGGPACLRLRTALTEAQVEAVQWTSRVILDQPLYDLLKSWIERHYRERIPPGDVANPSLLSESRVALDELTSILSLDSIYDFQKE